MIEKKKNLVRLIEQERGLGELLARSIPRGQNMTDCPSTEQLAEFIDGKRSPDSSKAIITHLAECEMCYAIVSDSLTVSEELSRRSRARRRRYIAYAIPSGLAAAAVLLLVFRIWQPAQESTMSKSKEIASRQERARPMTKARKEGGGGTTAPRSYAGDLAGRLMRQATIAPHARAEGRAPRPRAAFGFSSAVPPDKAAFRIGMCLTRIEVARQAKDHAAVEASVQQLIEMQKFMGSSYSPAPPPIGPGSEAGKSVPAADRYAGVSAAVEAMFDLKQEALYVKLGAWVEAAVLAAEGNDPAFFSTAEIQAFTTELKKQNEPIGTLNDLSRLDTIISSGTIQPDQFKAITRLLADIREMH